ncbi:MAG: hypothetical protein H6714_06330 [Myxococcales bacterium]|nr:hypothetical protein [Myxococcales bacterium]
MATDLTPPRSRLIVLYAVLSALILIALKFVLDGYFVRVSESQINQKVLTSPARELNEVMRAQLQTMESGTMSVPRAMRVYLRDGRTGLPAIAPLQSGDTRPLLGWNHYPNKRLPPSVIGMPTQEEMLAAGREHQNNKTPRESSQTGLKAESP